jgi:hypothetical protein
VEAFVDVPSGTIGKVLFIQVFDGNQLVAGAKLKLDSDTLLGPHRFQLFPENLLSKNTAESLNTVDVNVAVDICSEVKGRDCVERSESLGKGVAKIITLPGQGDRKIRLIPTFKAQ